jgi:proteic killer suppression protein
VDKRSASTNTPGEKTGRIDKRNVTQYTAPMIKSISHKGLETFFRTGSKAGIQPAHAGKLRIMLTALDAAESPEQMNAPNWRLHALSGNLNGFWSITINGNWRLIFRFEGKDAELVNYLDYH